MEPTEGILDFVRRRERLMLAGNGQHFEGLDYIAGMGFLHFFGDSGLNEETSRNIIADAAVLDLVREYFRRKARIFSELDLPTDADVLAYMTANPNI